MKNKHIVLPFTDAQYGMGAMAAMRRTRVAMPIVSHRPQVIAALPWYLSGDVPTANCLAAYKAIGATSLATSFINLINPGTYDLTGGVNPSWDQATGWNFNGTTQYKNTGITPATGETKTWSMICKFVALNSWVAMGCSTNYVASTSFAISPNQSASRAYQNGFVPLLVPSIATAGTIAIAGSNCYYNGIYEGSVILSDVISSEITIGAITGGAYFYAGAIFSAAIYNIILTPAQVLAISNRMPL